MQALHLLGLDHHVDQIGVGLGQPLAGRGLLLHIPHMRDAVAPELLGLIERFIGLRNQGGKGYLTAFADGSVRFLPAKIGRATLRALLTRNGEEIINLP